MLKKLTFIFLLCIAVSPAAYANWVEDWFDMMNTTNPSSYQGQERGFATAGGFQGRMKVKTDNLMTISPPRFNIGCGGIDIFMGGFSFLNADYMVEKLERIIRMAPALAFQVALNELSSTISEKVEGMEQIMNTLNSLQLDECQAAKAIATYPVDMVKLGPSKATSTVSQNIKSGAQNLWDTAMKDTRENPKKAFKDAVNSSTMPATLKAELLKDGSILANAGGKFGLTTNEINQIRALVGDVTTDGGVGFAYDPPCDEADFKSLIEGKPLTKTLSGTCTEAAGDNLQERTGKLIDSLTLKVAENPSGEPSEAEKGFVNMNPIPIKTLLNTAKQYGEPQVAAIADSVKAPSAYGFAYQILTSMMFNFKGTMVEYKAWMETGEPELVQSMSLAIEELLAVLEKKQEEAYREYSIQMTEIQKVYSLLNYYKETDKFISEVLKKNKFQKPNRS